MLTNYRRCRSAYTSYTPTTTDDDRRRLVIFSYDNGDASHAERSDTVSESPGPSSDIQFRCDGRIPEIRIRSHRRRAGDEKWDSPPLPRGGNKRRTTNDSKFGHDAGSHRARRGIRDDAAIAFDGSGARGSGGGGKQRKRTPQAPWRERIGITLTISRDGRIDIVRRNAWRSTRHVRRGGIELAGARGRSLVGP